jgi:hypothetical protein
MSAAKETAGKRFTSGVLLYTEASAFGADLFAIPPASLWRPLFSEEGWISDDFENMRLALVPPNPKEFVIAWVIGMRIAR